MSTLAPSSPCRRGWVTGVHGGYAQVLEAGQARDLPEVVEVEQPLDGVDLALLDLERLGQPGAQRCAHRGVDLEAHDLAEAPAAQLGLDRAQQVVGLVGDLEVRVAGDAEDAVVDDLHAREERVEVAGDEVLERRRRSGRPRPAGTKRGSISLGTLTRAKVVSCVCGSRTSTASDSDRFEM